MSWADAFSDEATLFRTTSTGLRVFAPAGVFGRLALVSDDEARRIQRDVRHRLWWLFMALPVLASRASTFWLLAATSLGSGWPSASGSPGASHVSLAAASR